MLVSDSSGAQNAPAPAAPSAAEADRVVAAQVDGRPIYVDEVRRRMERVLGKRKIEPEARPVLEAETLAHLVDRRLILRFLEKAKLAATEQDLDAEVQRIERQLGQQGATLDEYLQRTRQTHGDLKESLRWEVSWRTYLEKHLTDENLQKYFERRRREFDGTELRVAHLLLKPSQEQDAAALAATLEQAEELRASIVSGTITFAEAAKKHSISPTADQGGDIGWIGRKAPMPEPFSQAAFALKAGELSEPVVTPFGVHLIQVLEIKPGQKTWKDVRGELERAVTAYLFGWVADQQRPHAQVEYTGALPHFQPGTKRLAE
jgi:parvulin-like peptidyl-prolyl isomerase